MGRASNRKVINSLPVYHEAGHAVMAILAGARPIVHVSIKVVPNLYRAGVSRGRCVFASVPEDYRPTRAEIDANVLLLLGGPVATDILTGNVTRWTGMEDDHAMLELNVNLARAAAEQSGEQFDEQAYKRRAWQQCEFALTKHWPAVEALVRALQKERRLNGDRVRAIVGEAIRQGARSSIPHQPGRTGR